MSTFQHLRCVVLLLSNPHACFKRWCYKRDSNYALIAVVMVMRLEYLSSMQHDLPLGLCRATLSQLL